MGVYVVYACMRVRVYVIVCVSVNYVCDRVRFSRIGHLDLVRMFTCIVLLGPEPVNALLNCSQWLEHRTHKRIFGAYFGDN